jgi:hypothetical protein
MKYFNNHRDEVNKARLDRYYTHREEATQYKSHYLNKMKELASIKQDRLRKRREIKERSAPFLRPNEVGNRAYQGAEGHIGSMGTPTKRMISRAK